MRNNSIIIAVVLVLAIAGVTVALTTVATPQAPVMSGIGLNAPTTTISLGR